MNTRICNFSLLFGLCQGSATYDLWVKSSHWLLFTNKTLLGHSHTINLHIVSECSRATKAQLSSCHKDHLAHKAYIICYLVFHTASV